MCDHRRHETERNRPTTDSTTQTRLGLVAARQRADPSCAQARRDAPRGAIVASRSQMFQAQAHSKTSRTSVSFIRGAIEASGEILAPRRTRARLCGRLLDVGPHCSSDPAPIRRALSSQRSLACVAPNAVELPKAPASRRPTRRRGDCPLVALPVAADKKSGGNSARAWFLWTKVASVWSRRSNALGLRAGRPRLSVPACNITIVSTPSPAWSFRLVDARSNFAFRYVVAVSRGNKSLLFSSICSTSCVARSSWFGIMHRFTSAGPFRTFSLNSHACMSTTFPLMRLNSIRWNSSGHRWTPISRTASLFGSTISGLCFGALWHAYGVHLLDSGPASMLQA